MSLVNTRRNACWERTTLPAASERACPRTFDPFCHSCASLSSAFLASCSAFNAACSAFLARPASALLLVGFFPGISDGFKSVILGSMFDLYLGASWSADRPWVRSHPIVHSRLCKNERKRQIRRPWSWTLWRWGSWWPWRSWRRRKRWTVGCVLRLHIVHFVSDMICPMCQRREGRWPRWPWWARRSRRTGW